MPVDLKTNAAAQAIRQGTVDAARAGHVETLATATKQLDASKQTLGMQMDSYALAVSSPAYQRLSPAERDLFSHVYAEMLGNASAAFGTLAGKPTPQRIEAAFHEIESKLRYNVALSRAHGPGSGAVSPFEPGFKLEEHPEHILKYVHGIKADTSADAHIRVTYKQPELEEHATQFHIAAADMTGDNFLRALRTVLGGAFKDVELRTQSTEGGPIAVSPAEGAKPTAPVETSAQRFTRAAAELMKDVDNISVLAGRVLEAHMHTAELVPGLAVRLSLNSGAAFDQLKPEAEKAIANWLDAHGFSDLVSRNYLGNSIFVVGKDGALGL
jgi:hypothetical protein